MPIAIFATAILLTSLELVSSPVGSTAGAAHVVARSLPPREVYERVDLPVVVPLGAMISGTGWRHFWRATR